MTNEKEIIYEEEEKALDELSDRLVDGLQAIAQVSTICFTSSYSNIVLSQDELIKESMNAARNATLSYDSAKGMDFKEYVNRVVKYNLLIANMGKHLAQLKVDTYDPVASDLVDETIASLTKELGRRPDLSKVASKIDGCTVDDILAELRRAVIIGRLQELTKL